MLMEIDRIKGEFDSRFQVFHELMKNKIREVLLISSPYDAWMMEGDCRLSERIITEYRGLNLSHPPRLNWVSTVDDALEALVRDEHKYDMVIVMARSADTDAFAIGERIKGQVPELPVMLLSHQSLPMADCQLESWASKTTDGVFVWSGNTDILLALIKCAEDKMNVAYDARVAGIRVIIFVEDSPVYVSSLLPILYKELVSQTQAVIEEGLNDEHRLLAMRARPKILLAQSYEEAIELFDRFEPFVLGVISDVRFPRNCEMDDNAGVDLLKRIKKERFDVPLLLTSSEPANAQKAHDIPANFVDKNSLTLHAEVRAFLLNNLGFGDFIFKRPDGSPIDRASNLRSLEIVMEGIPEESFSYHANRNDFSRWLFARAEIELASKVRPIRDDDFHTIEQHRTHLVNLIHDRRMKRQKGVVVNFEAGEFDLDTEFFKIGTGSLGGKGRGLAFISSFLQQHPGINEKFGQVDIFIPQTLVITTEAFDAFVDGNHLRWFSKARVPDEEIVEAFLGSDFPVAIQRDLKAFLTYVTYPLAVRSSGLLEDAQFRAYAGLYKTYMLPNDDPDLEVRLNQLIQAVKLVYASTYFEGPKAFSRRVGHHTEEEKMAVIIQRIVGARHGNYLYPAISGVAQSYNYYPFAKMKSEEGIATIALGLGKTVMEGGKALRFSPRYPELLPQRFSVNDILENAQNHFYALKIDGAKPIIDLNETATLEKREVFDAISESSVKFLASTYIPEEHRIKDSSMGRGSPVLTFAPVLKYGAFPLAEILSTVLTLGEEGMGCQVELEFSVNLGNGDTRRPEFAILQMRPMTAREELLEVDITPDEIDRAVCFSNQALGNGIRNNLCDVLYVKPDGFDPAQTPKIAREIGKMNAELINENRKYLLIGPGRWGSSDRWLGIPVTWPEICGVGAMLETAHPHLKAEPSQGSHFFHNITSLGINYANVSEEKGDTIDWRWLTSLPKYREMEYVAHVRLEQPLFLKVDGRTSRCVIIHAGSPGTEKQVDGSPAGGAKITV